MVGAVTIDAPEAYIISGLRVLTPDVNAPEAYVLTAVKFPSEGVDAAQGYVTVGVLENRYVQAAQAYVLIAGRGQFDNPRVRAWGFSQDGHDFYVLRLGMDATIIYDTTTGQWAEWDGAGQAFWRASLGLNWIGIARANYDTGGMETPVVAGDDTYGMIWNLYPEQGYDESIDSSIDYNVVTRAVRGGIPFRGRNRTRTNGLWLTISNGQPVIPLAAVTLRTSDDQGVTWTSRGTITVTPSDYSQNLFWRSLGLIQAPGRLFEFEDDGAMIRIDGADIDMSKDDQGGPSH